jgi:hypothetical protein
MIKVHALNRRVRVDRKEGERITDNATCNAILAIDPRNDDRHTRINVRLTAEEERAFDELAAKIEQRLLVDLANSEKPVALPIEATTEVPAATDEPEQTGAASV